VPLNDPAGEPFSALADNLRELEIVIGEKARLAVAELRTALEQAAARRSAGDLSGALTLIRQAMERLASLAGELDADEGMMMRAIAQRFSQALNLGDKGAAKEAIAVMRRRAGDTKDEDPADW
jgi:hypothetical protein